MRVVRLGDFYRSFENSCTSTGGPIAIMLGRLRISIQESITAYSDIKGETSRESKRQNPK